MRESPLLTHLLIAWVMKNVSQPLCRPIILRESKILIKKKNVVKWRLILLVWFYPAWMMKIIRIYLDREHRDPIETLEKLRKTFGFPDLEFLLIIIQTNTKIFGHVQWSIKNFWKFFGNI